jgi:RimJ/RimL family protein N-acetyltransferase
MSDIASESGLPDFETSRLRLRPRSLADTEACLAMDREPDVARFVPEVLRMVCGPEADAIAHRAFVEERTRGPYPRGLGYWTICPRAAEDVFLGWVLLIPVDAVGPEVEIGWRLRRSAWGQGYASEAAAVLVPHGLIGLGLPEVIADIDPANLGSIRVAEKIGLRRRGPTPQWDGLVRYALTREEFSG